MEGVLEWLRRLRRCCARLDPLILLAIMVTLWSDVSAAQTSGDQQCPKTRELVTTVWGGVVTLLVLSFDSWGTVKSLMDDESTLDKVKGWIVLLILAILNPGTMLLYLVECAAWSYDMMRRVPEFTIMSL